MPGSGQNDSAKLSGFLLYRPIDERVAVIRKGQGYQPPAGESALDPGLAQFRLSVRALEEVAIEAGTNLYVHSSAASQPGVWNVEGEG
jgi:hypothetical protein